MVRLISSVRRNIFPVVSRDGVLLGVVQLDDLRADMFDPAKYDTKIDAYIDPAARRGLSQRADGQRARCVRAVEGVDASGDRQRPALPRLYLQVAHPGGLPRPAGRDQRRVTARLSSRSRILLGLSLPLSRLPCIVLPPCIRSFRPQ
ncbi:MAG: hypothetical protein ACLR8Y_07470 [Alistipes indistinctus]